jgi:hypothetical protein
MCCGAYGFLAEYIVGEDCGQLASEIHAKAAHGVGE